VKVEHYTHGKSPKKILKIKHMNNPQTPLDWKMPTMKMNLDKKIHKGGGGTILNPWLTKKCTRLAM
jgi:hypothetical protein